MDCFQRCVREEGVLSLWRGNWANVLRYFPTQAINFSVKDALNRVFLQGVSAETQKTKYFLMSLLSGGLAGSFSLIFVYPLDFARTRLGADIGKAAGERQFSGLFDCCRQILAKDGIKGLYQGFLVSVLGIFTYRAFYFGYEYVYAQRVRRRQEIHLGHFVITEKSIILSQVRLCSVCHIDLRDARLSPRHHPKEADDGERQGSLLEAVQGHNRLRVQNPKPGGSDRVLQRQLVQLLEEHRQLTGAGSLRRATENVLAPWQSLIN